MFIVSIFCYPILPPFMPICFLSILFAKTRNYWSTQPIRSRSQNNAEDNYE